MKILITGTSGIVGKEIAKNLRKYKKFKVYETSNKNIKKNLSKKNYFYYQNLIKPIRIKENFDIVIHCAAKHPFSKYGIHMKKVFSDNVKITKNLINFANKSNVKYFFFLSSIDVYGNINSNSVSEYKKPNKPNLYGKSKLLSEKILCNKKNKFKTICLRLPGIFAIDLSRNYPLIVNLVKKIKRKKNLIIYNSNNNFNNIIDTNEITKFLVFVLNKGFKTSAIFNFSASKPIKFSTTINLIKKIFKSNSKIIIKNEKKQSFTIQNKKLIKKFNYNIASTENIIKRCCDQILTKYKKNL